MGGEHLRHLGQPARTTTTPLAQDGACPDNRVGSYREPLVHALRKNYIHDNNNPNVPRGGAAALGPWGRASCSRAAGTTP